MELKAVTMGTIRKGPILGPVKKMKNGGKLTHTYHLCEYVKLVYARAEYKVFFFKGWLDIEIKIDEV